jgi:redox-sensitive bicupin YhaK (pirin superfamily)
VIDARLRCRERGAGAPSRSKVLRVQAIPDNAGYGPFVMNSVDEIERAFEDFRAGRFGEIKPLVAE